VLAPVKLVNPPLPAVVLYPPLVPFPAAPTTAVNCSPPTTVYTLSEIYAPEPPPPPADSPPALS